MKKLINFLLMTMVCFQLFGQAAGNYYFSQSKSKSGVMPSSGLNYDYESSNRAYPQAQQMPYTTYTTISDTSFSIQASAIMNVIADEYVMILGTSQIGETLEDCHNMINKRLESFKESLQKIGITNDEIYIDYISQFPIFEIQVEKKLFSKTYHEIPSGFELKKNIHIHFKEQGLAEKIMIEAAKNEVYDIIKVDYVIKNQQAIYDTLRLSCIKYIQKKVMEFQKLGIKTESEYQLIFEDIHTTYPLERYSTYGEFARYTSNSSKMGSKVISTYDIPSLYYNALAYNNFDIVINPLIKSPVVQFTYTLRTKYILKKR